MSKEEEMMEDIIYLQEKLLAALVIPKGYAGCYSKYTLKEKHPSIKG